jgi:hypothetical protein
MGQHGSLELYSSGRNQREALSTKVNPGKIKPRLLGQMSTQLSTQCSIR